MNARAEALVAAVVAEGQPADALPMAQYMRNQFEFAGVRSQKRRGVLRQFVTQNGLPAGHDLPQFVHDVWKCGIREAAYCAQEIAAKKAFVREPYYRNLIEFMVCHNSWWDTVDFIAAHCAGPWMEANAQQREEVFERWNAHPNFWMNRTAILFQLAYRDIDLGYVRRCLERHSTSEEFFIQKALGWMLRQASKKQKAGVKTLIADFVLKPVTKREAVKYLGKS